MDTPKFCHIHPVILQGLHVVLGAEENDIDGSINFITLGGDSLTAIKLASYCRERNVPLSVREILHSGRIDQLVEHAATCTLPNGLPSPATTANTQSRCSPAPLSITECNPPHQLPTTPPETSALPTSQTNALYLEELTEMQNCFIHGSRKNPDLNIIRFSQTYRFNDLSAVQCAWNTVIELEPIFQPQSLERIQSPNGPCQWIEIVVDDEISYQKELAKVESCPSPVSCFKAVTWIRPQGLAPISTVIWHVHHAFIDGYSAQLIHAKVHKVVNGHPVSPGTSFWTVAAELKMLQQENRTSARKFWDHQYSTFAAAGGDFRILSHPEIEATPHSQSSLTIKLPHDRLVSCSKRSGVTPVTYYCAAWGLTMSKFMDCEQTCFGMVFSGRDLPLSGIQDAIGPFINTMPFFVSTAQAATRTASSFLQETFDRLVEFSRFEFSQPEDGFTRQFSSLLASQFDIDDEISDAPGSIRPISRSVFNMQSDIPLCVLIGQRGEVQICFHTNKYTETDIQLLGEHFQNAIDSLLEPENSILSCLDRLITDNTRETLLHMSNCYAESTFESSKNDDIVTLFERTSAKYPREIAVARGKHELTYETFDAAAGHVALALDWINPREPVCVLADRSINWLIAIFGILKAGGVYAPLDPSVPSSVRDLNFRRSGARAFITSSKVPLEAQPLEAGVCLIVEEILSQNISSLGYPRRQFPRPDEPAYICFTSGSTGISKAVQCTHKSLVAFQKDEEVRLFTSNGTTVAQIMSPVFDGSIHEIFSTLCYGAMLRLPDQDAADPFSHLKECSSAILTPSLAKVLSPYDYPKLKNVYLVGEAVPQFVCDSWAKGRRLYNMYGPTEATCGATIKRLQPEQPISIGHPNPSSRVYVLDRNRQLMPPGAVGEIFIAGIQVSQGYLGQPDETGAKFLSDSVLPEREERMYKTGDRGYWNLYSREIHCLGRTDRQIKLRGFRLDLDDLEIRVARAVPESEAVAIFRKGDYLIAVLQPSSLDVPSVRSRISRALPGYAAPRRIIVLDEFPLTPAGKLDYKALDAVEDTPTLKSMAPVLSGTEKVLTQAWRQILHLDSEIDISAESDFITLGGHSVLQLRLANHLSTIFKRSVSVKTVIVNSALQNLAKAIDNSTEAEDIDFKSSIYERPLGGNGVSPIEQDWFWKYKAGLGTSAFNVSCVYALDPAVVDRKRLGRAWNKIMARHKMLRSRYTLCGGMVRRTYGAVPPRARRVKRAKIRNIINAEFDLESEDPIRIIISSRYMVVCVSHIICDLTTLRALFKELIATYTETLPIASVTRSYEDTCWDGPIDASITAFWKSYLSGIYGLAKPFPQHLRQSYAGASYVSKFPLSSITAIQYVADKYNLTYHQIALALVSLVLPKHPYSSDMVLGSPFLGRSSQDQDTIGLFLQPLPIRIPHAQPSTLLQTFLHSVRASSQSSLANALPWNQLLETLDIPLCASTLPSPHPLFDVMVTFHDEQDGGLTKLPLDGFEPLVTWTEGAKFGIMFEFCLTAKFLMLRIEYGEGLFSGEEVRELVRRVGRAMKGLKTGGVVGEVVERVEGDGEMMDERSEVKFGCKRARV